MSLNPVQTRIIIAGATLATFACLCVPWIRMHNGHQTAIGYSFIFTPPQPTDPYYSFRIDIVRLALGLAATLIGCTVSVWAFRDKPVASPDDPIRPDAIKVLRRP